MEGNGQITNPWNRGILYKKCTSEVDALTRKTSCNFADIELAVLKTTTFGKNMRPYHVFGIIGEFLGVSAGDKKYFTNQVLPFLSKVLLRENILGTDTFTFTAGQNRYFGVGVDEFGNLLYKDGDSTYSGVGISFYRDSLGRLNTRVPYKKSVINYNWKFFVRTEKQLNTIKRVQALIPCM